MSNTVKVKKKRKIGIFNVVNATILIVFALICIFPFIYEVLISFSSKTDFYQSSFLVIPKHFNFENYKYIFSQNNILTSFLISLFVTCVGVTFSMVLTTIGAYALSRKDMFLGKTLFIFVLFTMFFGGGLIPFYLVVKNLGLASYNFTSVFSIIIPFGISGFNMIILRNFFRAVPEEIIESCYIDGASQIRIMAQFVVPLCKAGIATIALFYAVDRWNDWYWPLLFINNADYAPLSLALRNVLMSNTAAGGGSGIDSTITFAEGQGAATIIIAIAPILAVYPFVQKYFVRGVMLGGVKG